MTQLAIFEMTPRQARLVKPDPHRRGWVVMPHESSYGPAGTAVPAWVCCNCRGAVTSGFQRAWWHGCCGEILAPRCADPGWRSRLPGWALAVNDAWVSELPAGVAA